MEGKPRPVQCIFDFFNPLPGYDSLVIEFDRIAGFPSKVRDYKADSWKKQRMS